MFQINTSLLVVYQSINIFTQVTLYPFFLSKRSWHSLLQTFFKTSTFTTFSLFLTLKEVCNISNKC